MQCFIRLIHLGPTAHCIHTFPTLPLNAADAILWLINDNGLLWVTEGDDFSSIYFGAACKANYALHPIEKYHGRSFYFCKNEFCKKNG
jgi:hypothetical protein